MSPRHKKPRKCKCPFKKLKGKAFKPVGIPMDELEMVILYRDELEAMRLCDFEGMTQYEAGKNMGVSRGTIQRLVTSARQKITKAIIECKAISFEKEQYT
ncbi:MAG: DUF134 domain-containing protein [Thermodesulfovibrionales bacterium]|nr:DUF134 domain-containing protein [Thermodesulfovibrionales bacterium]